MLIVKKPIYPHRSLRFAGEYRVRSEVIYEGDFRDGMMHGTGRLLLLSGEVWAGHFWKVVRFKGKQLKILLD